MLEGPGSARIQGRGPGRRSQLLGHLVHDARHHGPALRRGRGVRLLEEAPPQRQSVHQVGLGADQGRGPVARPPIGIVFMHDAVTMVVRGSPIKVVAPCEGTGYEIGSMSIIKGARNLDAAKKFYEWALSAAAQNLGAQVESFQVPSNKGATTPQRGPQARRHQAHRLRLRQRRLVRRAQAPARQVEQRGQVPPELGSMTRTPRYSPGS